MTTILGISGSLRAGSYNTALLRAAQALAAPGVTLEAVTLHGIPLYDGDVERRDGLPAAVLQLKQRIIASDGVLLVTPEYNSGIPGVFKNAIDWLSRPAADIPRVFGDRPFALAGARRAALARSSRRMRGCPCCASSACATGPAARSWSRGRPRCSTRTARSATRRSASSSAIS
jgi:NAD(P)H-dependent FMN reductase